MYRAYSSTRHAEQAASRARELLFDNRFQPVRPWTRQTAHQLLCRNMRTDTQADGLNFYLIHFTIYFTDFSSLNNRMYGSYDERTKAFNG